MKLYNEDCLDVLKEIPDESVDCVVTDCPYHIVGGGTRKEKLDDEPSGIFNRRNDYIPQKTRGGYLMKEGSKHVSLSGILNDSDATTYAKNGKLFKHNDIKFEDWLPEVYRVLKQNTHCYIMINPRNLAELQTKAEKVGFKFQQILIWQKNKQRQINII